MAVSSRILERGSGRFRRPKLRTGKPKRFMTNRRIFVQNPLKSYALLLLLFLLPLSAAGIVAVYREPGNVTSYLLLAAVVGITFGMVGVKKHTRVVCDADACEVTTRNIF